MGWFKKFMVYQAYRTGWKNGYRRAQMDATGIERGRSGAEAGRYDD